MSPVLPAPAAARLSPLIGACLAATWLIWGSTYLAIKWALASLPPFFQMGSRFLAAGVLLGAFALLRGAHWPGRTQWLNAGLLGLLMLGGGYGATACAEQTVDSGLVVAFIAVVPALVALCEWPYGLRPSRAEAAGIALGLAGVLLLARGQGFAASLPGLLWLLLACATWTIGSVWARHGLPGGRPLTLAPGAAGYASQMLCGGALLLAASLWVGEWSAWPPDARSVASWAWLVGAGSIVAFSAYMLLLQRTSTALASSYTFVNPLIGLLLGAALGGESISAAEMGAAGVILVGLMLLLAGRRFGNGRPLAVRRRSGHPRALESRP